MDGWQPLIFIARGINWLAAGMTALFLAIAPPPAAGAGAASSGDQAAAAQRFASLQVEIWPEFDRRGAALIILKGELAASVALPASVSLRIPASSEPTAVAFATAPDSGLFNLKHEQTRGEGYTTLRFTTAHRFLHVEFYDPIQAASEERRFDYDWPGDLAVDRLTVRLQEPAGITTLSTKPGLQAAGKGPDGLLYQEAQLGSFKAGQRATLEVRYTKTDGRTSAEILGLNAAVPAPAQAVAPSPEGGSAEMPSRWLIAGVLAAIALVVVGFVLLWPRLRGQESGTRPHAAGFCAKCGRQLARGDRFCAQCGTPVRK